MGALGAMGGILPVLGGLTKAVGAVSGAVNAVNFVTGRDQNQTLKMLRERQNLTQAQLEANAALDKERLAAQADADKSSRLAALRRAMARQRAQFGASGVGSAGGSSQAVLLGLFDETEEELAQREKLDGIRSRATDLDVSNSRSLNLLNATQLAQRQNLQRYYL
ncbi:MAG: hypothetical protein ACT4OY_08635 [Alphaproteobacteria bacterium]